MIYTEQLEKRILKIAAISQHLVRYTQFCTNLLVFTYDRFYFCVYLSFKIGIPKNYRALYKFNGSCHLTLYIYFRLVLKEFRIKASSVTKTDFKTIEHLLRFGYKQVKLIQMPGFRSGSTTREIPSK